MSKDKYRAIDVKRGEFPGLAVPPADVDRICKGEWAGGERP